MKIHILPAAFMAAVTNYHEVSIKHGKDSKEARAAFQQSLQVTPDFIKKGVHQMMVRDAANDADFSAPTTN